MKLKTILLINESIDDLGSVIEGQGWFCHKESNNSDIKRSGASIYITEGEPYKFSVRIKTHGLRKPTDTNESYRERIKKHTDKVSKAWISKAKKLHNSPELNEVGNEIKLSWKQAFKEALQDPTLQAHISEIMETPNERKEQISDPVNFSLVTESAKRWSAVVIDGSSKSKLISTFKDKIPEGWEVIAHHQTIDPFGLSDDEGEKVHLQVTHVGKSDKALAVKVKGYKGKTNNKFAHITIAINKSGGAKPKDSNDITDWESVNSSLSLNGTVENL